MNFNEQADYDFCECCQDRPARIGSSWGIDYCSKECRDKDRAKREQDAEHERIAEITSGGQV